MFPIIGMGLITAGALKSLRKKAKVKITVTGSTRGRPSKEDKPVKGKMRLTIAEKMQDSDYQKHIKAIEADLNKRLSKSTAGGKPLPKKAKKVSEK